MLTFVLLIFLFSSASFQNDDTEYEPLPDYYATLNVSPTAKLSEIKKSFRKLAMQYHPDKNKDEGAQEKFQELSEAYSILSDSEKRKEYDELYMDEVVEEEPDQQDQEERDHYENSGYADKPREYAADSAKEPEEDIWGDLDDETLFKVLKFLADNEYEISKKTTRVIPEVYENYQDNYDEYTRYRQANEQYHRHEHREEQPRYRWTREAQHNLHQFESKPSWEETHGSLPHGFCRTTIRWEGGVKVTNRSCYWLWNWLNMLM